MDMWNRTRTLNELGVTVDLVATVGKEPSSESRAQVERLVRRLYLTKRDSGRKGLLSLRAGHVAIRSSLRTLFLEDKYDVVLMQTEFTSDILRNPTLRYRTSIVRVDNDEFDYHIQTARTEPSLVMKLYYYFEALRVRLHSKRILPAVEMLWFVSHDEMDRYRERADPDRKQCIDFMPTAVDFNLLGEVALEGAQVLFVGNLWAPLNRTAVEWYIERVHPQLRDVPGYRLVIAGSIRDQRRDWIDNLTRAHSNIETHFDPADLSPFYKSSALFVNPMQGGAGVKLKTIEAILRGMPLVTTRSGAEGSGLVDSLHCKRAEGEQEFADAVRALIVDKAGARAMVRRAQGFIREHYDQRAVLKRLLSELDRRACGGEVFEPGTQIRR